MNRTQRSNLLHAIEACSMAKGWLSTSAPADRDRPTEYLTQAIAHITAALEDQGGDEG